VERRVHPAFEPGVDQLLGDAEIREIDVSLAIEQDVVGLDVSMHPAALVNEVQCLCDRFQPTHHFVEVLDVIPESP
jgi:hypothetical protein